MKQIIILCVSAILLTACSTVPVTGRRQLNIIPSSQIMSLSNQQFTEFMQQTPLSNDMAGRAAVQRVGKRIQAAVEEYLRQQNQLHLLDGFAWEFHLVQSPQVNAFAMPGGKIVFYDGIMPLTQNDTGIAVVMGHEIAHVVAQHGSERMSQQMMAQLGSAAAAIAVSGQSETTQAIAGTVFGAGAQLGVLLPYSRKHELEADRLGMIFMAMAGFNPSDAIPFWQRMSENGSASVAEFMSTHPSDATRIREMHRALPEAMKFYRPAAGSGTSSSWSF